MSRPHHSRPETIRFQLLSDLHAELHPADVPACEAVATDADIVIVAGDTARADDAVDVACDLFPDAPVLALVGGNHEHYRTGATIAAGIETMRGAARHASTMQGRDVVFMENDECVVEAHGVPVRILGCTLWTDYGLYGDPELHGPQAHAGMADSRLIRGSTPGRFYDPGFVTWSELRDRCRQSTAFLEEALARPHDGPTTVVTHHLPSLRSVAAQYEGSIVNAGFASSLDHLVAAGAILWAHGHTHCGVQWREPMGGTLVACNPAGYVDRRRRENPVFEPRLLVTVTREDGCWVAST